MHRNAIKCRSSSAGHDRITRAPQSRPERLDVSVSAIQSPKRNNGKTLSQRATPRQLKKAAAAFGLKLEKLELQPHSPSRPRNRRSSLQCIQQPLPASSRAKRAAAPTFSEEEEEEEEEFSEAQTSFSRSLPRYMYPSDEDDIDPEVEDIMLEFGIDYHSAEFMWHMYEADN